MSAQHTPGPWTVERSFTSGYRKCPAIQADDPRDGLMFELCVVFGEYDDNTPTDTTEANARLIAAAPDLLAALENLTPILEAAESNASGNPEWKWVSSRINTARAAIAKAEGRQ